MIDLTCFVCGLPMVHYRLYGYRCHNPHHNELEADRSIWMAIRSSNIITDDELTDDEIDAALEGSEPLQPSERLHERALKAMREAQKNRAVKLN